MTPPKLASSSHGSLGKGPRDESLKKSIRDPMQHGVNLNENWVEKQSSYIMQINDLCNKN